MGKICVWNCSASFNRHLSIPPCASHFAAAFASFAVSRLRDRSLVRPPHVERVSKSERWLAMVGLRSLSLAGPTDCHLRTCLHYPVAHRPRYLFTCSPVLVLPCSCTPRETLPLWKNGHGVTHADFTPVFPSFLRECTTKTPNTPDNKSLEAARLEGVSRRFVQPLLAQRVAPGRWLKRTGREHRRCQCPRPARVSLWG